MSRHMTIPLAHGFDPQALPPLAEPVAGTKPWQWLADPEVDPDLKSAYIQERVTGFGTVDPHERGLRHRPLPEEDVIASHLTQDVFFTFAGAPQVRVCLRQGTVGVFPFDAPVAIVGTAPGWRPTGGGAGWRTSSWWTTATTPPSASRPDSTCSRT